MGRVRVRPALQEECWPLQSQLGRVKVRRAEECWPLQSHLHMALEKWRGSQNQLWLAHGPVGETGCTSPVARDTVEASLSSRWENRGKRDAEVGPSVDMERSYTPDASQWSLPLPPCRVSCIDSCRGTDGASHCCDMPTTGPPAFSYRHGRPQP
jgi:hypothetical protein